MLSRDEEGGGVKRRERGTEPETILSLFKGIKTAKLWGGKKRWNNVGMGLAFLCHASKRRQTSGMDGKLVRREEKLHHQSSCCVCVCLRSGFFYYSLLFSPLFPVYSDTEFGLKAEKRLILKLNLPQVTWMSCTQMRHDGNIYLKLQANMSAHDRYRPAQFREKPRPQPWPTPPVQRTWTRRSSAEPPTQRCIKEYSKTRGQWTCNVSAYASAWFWLDVNWHSTVQREKISQSLADAQVCV